MKKMLNEGNRNQIHNFISNSGSASQKVTVPTVPVQRRGGAEYFDSRKKGKI
jgi:hypothetical protein